MAEQAIQRRLAAILAADIAGYTRLMEADEDATVRAWHAARADIIDPSIESHGGRIVKHTGDGFLAEFGTVIDVVRAALEMQAALGVRNEGAAEGRRMDFRMGINLGDIMVDAEDIHGDGVNLAARLESLAEPGGICVSADVYNQVRKRVDAAFEDMGEQTVKNVSAPVRAYRVALNAGEVEKQAEAVLRLPAIAVLPFDNMSGDAEQEYFVDGLTEDIITALAAWRSFPVIGRNSTFTYKGASVTAQQVAKELGARYVLEGSVRRGGERIRVTAQLIDCETGHHLWAEKFDRDLIDTFDLQDEITRRIVSTIVPELERAERDRSRNKPPENLQAWDYYLRGMAYLNEMDRRAVPEGRAMFERAIKADPNFAKAHARLALMLYREFYMGLKEPTPELAEALVSEAKKAVALDDTDSACHWIRAISHWYVGEFDLAIGASKKACALNPASVDAHFTLGMGYFQAGRPKDAIPIFQRAIEFSPKEPRQKLFYSILAQAYLELGDYEGAIAAARNAIEQGAEPVLHDNPGTRAHVVLAAALGYLGQADEARAVIERMGKDVVTLENFNMLYRSVGSTQGDPSIALEGLRKAGVEI